MRIVKPSARVMKHDCTPYEFIEKVGRTCYKSEDHITEGSAEKFVAGLVKREHMAMLEHETLYVTMTPYLMRYFLEEMSQMEEQLKYFNVTHSCGVNIISGSFRSFYDLFNKGYYDHDDRSVTWYMRNRLQVAYPLVFGTPTYTTEWYGSCTLKLLSRDEFIKEFEDRPSILFKHLTHTFLFVCDRGVSHEFVRHRPASYAQESTRYCCYVKEKFGSEISVIDPCFWEDNFNMFTEWKSAMKIAESHYFSLIEMGATPQEARTVLPNSLKTEIIITATEEEWQHIVNLRYLGTTGAPHPQIKEVMGLAIEDIINETKGRVNLLDKGAK